MRLEGDYYRLVGMAGEGTFRLALLPGCAVYRGHFPGHPVCPGVYQIATVKECAERLAGCRLHIGTIRRCRLTAVATPATTTEVEVRVTLRPTERGYSVSATMSDALHIYMDYQGEMNP